ncbi:MAG: MarR family winged helix-turn-helix transcriptional regulator [Hyphomicrobiaceae bacterium]
MTEVGSPQLTPRQYAVLLTVSLDEGLNQTKLVERTGIDRSTLADLVRRLVTKGMLQRKRTKEDARSYAVRLTRTGKDALESSAPAVGKVEDRILNALPQEHREQFIVDLMTIIEALGNKQEE